MFKRAKKFFITAGCGEGQTSLNAFDQALLNAGIGNLNLIKITSILPPECKEIKPEKIAAGSFTAVVYTAMTGKKKGQILSAAIGVGIPEKISKPGLIMEYKHKGKKAEAEKMVKKMLAEGFRMRKEHLKEVRIKSIQHQVKKIGAVCAALVFTS